MLLFGFIMSSNVVVVVFHVHHKLFLFFSLLFLFFSIDSLNHQLISLKFEFAYAIIMLSSLGSFVFFLFACFTQILTKSSISIVWSCNKAIPSLFDIKPFVKTLIFNSLPLRQIHSILKRKFSFNGAWVYEGLKQTNSTHKNYPRFNK